MACSPFFAQARPATQAGGYSIAGTVVNSATGEPVRGATVAALAVADSRTVSSVETGEDGHFSLGGLAAAKYQLTVSKRGFRTAFYDEHEEFSSAIVTGPEQETERLTFRLTPGGVIRGMVLSDGGDPIDDGRVMLFKKAAAGKPGPRVNLVDTTRTDDTGAYEMANLAPGEYTVAVIAEPWYADNRAPKGRGTGSPEGAQANSALDVAYPVTYFDSTTEEGSATPLQVTGGSRQEADITLHAVPALHIRVQTPRKPDGAIARAELRQVVLGIPLGDVGGGTFDAVEGGTMEFRGVAPGQYELSQGDPPRIALLDAAASQQVDPAIGAAAVSISGTMRSTAGQAPPDSTIMLVPYNRTRGVVSTACVRGAFNFPAVPPGEWELQVASTGAANVAPPAVVSISLDGKTRAGDLVTVRDRPMTIRATVGQGTTEVQGFARRDGKGVAGVMMVLVPKGLGGMPSLARRDQSDSDGSFSLRNVVPGQYTLVAIQDGWDVDWTEPDVIARYLPGGLAVPVSDDAGKLMTLPTAVPVQDRLP